MEDNSQFFTPDNNAESQPIKKIALSNGIALQTSYIKSRSRQNLIPPTNSLVIDGIPGIPFEAGTPNPDVFYQGEDIVYDLFLFYNGDAVSLEDYDIKVGIKTSPRAYEMTFEASIDNGLYIVPGDKGYYELWIPSAITSEMLAGSYYLDVILIEKVGRGKGKFDRKHVLLQGHFNVEYSNYSPAPESVSRNAGASKRGTLENTWPNKPNTIGQRPAPPDTLYAS